MSANGGNKDAKEGGVCIAQIERRKQGTDRF
jgi:hypothetical protein